MASQIRHAIDLKEAASLGNPFEAHMAAPDTEALLDVEHTVDAEFSAARPAHDKLEKLLSLKDSIRKSAHIEVAPEEEMWRDELDAAVKAVDQRG